MKYAVYGFGFENDEIDIRHLTVFGKAYKRVKLCPIYRKVCKMLRSDMLSELGHSDTNISINYNLSGCDYKDTSFYWILRASLSSGRSIRVVGESSRFCALHETLPITGNDTAITRYRRYEEDETESESNEDSQNDYCFSFMPYYEYDYELYDWTGKRYSSFCNHVLI